MEASYGDSGWARIRHEDLPGDLFLRLEDDGHGRLRTRDFCLRGAWRPIVGADLREMNLPGIEEWLQTDRDLIEGHAGLPAPTLDDLAASFPEGRPAGEPGPRVPRLQRPTNG